MGLYFDHAATTSMFSEAVEVMVEELSNCGNPSSLHSAGRRARSVVEKGRELVAAAVGADTAEIVFTSGGTEANNLAIKGMFLFQNRKDSERNILVISSIEHHSVIDAALWLEKFCAAHIVWIPVDRYGFVDIDFLYDICKKYAHKIALVSVMLANNEVGSIQDVRSVVDVVKSFGILVHSDAVQGFTQVPFDFCSLGLDAATVSAHKIGGPAGVGALVVGRKTGVVPLLHGGGQERALRSGTAAAPHIAAFGVAADIAFARQSQYSENLRRLCSMLISGVRELIPGALLQGSDDLSLRIPSNVSFVFPGCDGETLLFLLDQVGVQSSTGAACNAGVVSVSHVLLAMGVVGDVARGVQRFSLGHSSTEADVVSLLDVLPSVVVKAQQANS